jgi:hypothetical protein
MANVVDEVIQFLVAHRPCPECGSRFRPENVHVLGQPEHWTWDLAAVCHTCHAMTMVSAEVRPEPAPAPAGRQRGQAGELTAAEQTYFAELAPVGVDDVLDMVEFLAAFNGDFRGLFSHGAHEHDVP